MNKKEQIIWWLLGWRETYPFEEEKEIYYDPIEYVQESTAKHRLFHFIIKNRQDSPYSHDFEAEITAKTPTEAIEKLANETGFDKKILAENYEEIENNN